MRDPGSVIVLLVATMACRGPEGVGTVASGTLVTERFVFGRPASAEDIARVDTDVMPDGSGLPPGQGTVQRGEVVYARTCIACHGPTGKEGPFDVLVGRVADDGFPFGDAPGTGTTIGNYWPHAPTVFDYVRRSMPFDAPGSLRDDDVYSVVALLLHWNDLIPSDAVVDARYLSSVDMPAADRFVMDDRSGGPVVR